MAKLSLTVRRGKPNAGGSYNIKVSVASKGRTCFIPTHCTISSEREWRGGRVVGRPDASLLNRRLLSLLTEYESILERYPFTESMEAKDVKEFLVRKHTRVEYVGSYGRDFVKRLRDNGQLSYARNMEYSLRYLLECFGESLSFVEIDARSLLRWERFLFGRGDSSTTVNIRMSHLKALLNSAVADGVAEYAVFPFLRYRMPEKAVRDIWISREELAALRAATFKGVSARRLELARDLFMLSFYCAGINLADLVEADMRGDVLTFVRKKTAGKKRGVKEVSITIQPEARSIIDRYVDSSGKLDFGYGFSDYAQFRSFVTKSLNRIGSDLGFERRLMFYSARKTFCQFGFELGVPLFVLEYAIGQTIKEANNRPIFDYIRIMRKQADAAIRAVIDYSLQS